MTTIKEIQEQIVPQWVRVIGSTYDEDDDEARARIGGEYEVKFWHLEDDIVSVSNKDKSDSWLFNRSDVQILTPVVHKGYRIGIGDMVNGCYEVIGHVWWDGKWRLSTLRSGDIKESSYWPEEDIEFVTPLYPAKDAEVEKAIKVLTDKGLLKDGRVIIK